MLAFEVPVGSTYEATVFLEIPNDHDRQKTKAGGHVEIDDNLYAEIETNGELLLEENLKNNLERWIGKKISWSERAWRNRSPHTKHFIVL